MAITTLATPYEVVKYSQAGRDYPTDKICNILPQVEEEFGYDCLGETLYEYLLGELEAYPDNVEDWSSDGSYDIDDYVVRFGCLYKSLIDCNRNDPADEVEGAWEVPARFGDNQCANELWDNYLRQIIALKTYVLSINSTSMKSGPNGITVLENPDRFQGSGTRTANKAERSDYKVDHLKTIEIITRNMLRWAQKKVSNDSTCEVPLSSMLECNGLCKPASKSRRRWGFKV